MNINDFNKLEYIEKQYEKINPAYVRLEELPIIIEQLKIR